VLVDVHTHFYPQAYLERLVREAPGIRVRTDGCGARGPRCPCPGGADPGTGQAPAFSWAVEVAGLVGSGLLALRNWRLAHQPRAQLVPQPAPGSAPPPL
jgi:hypothetical protein